MAKRTAAKKTAPRAAELTINDIIHLLTAAETTRNPVCVVTGPEEVLRRLVIDRLTAVKPDNTQLIKIHATDKEAATTIDDTAQPSLFNDTNWIHIRELEEAGDSVREAIERALPTISDGSRLILEHAGGNQGTGIIRAATRTGADVFTAAPIATAALPPLLTAHADDHGATLPPDAAELLIDIIGHNTTALFSAVQQLAADTGTGTITRALVRDTLAGEGITDMWEIADHVWLRDTGTALTMFRRLVEQEGADSACVQTAIALPFALRPLARHLAGEPLNALRVKRSKLPIIAAQATRWDEAGVMAAASVLAVADAAMKGGLGPGTALDNDQKLYVMERLIIDLTQGTATS